MGDDARQYPIHNGEPRPRSKLPPPERKEIELELHAAHDRLQHVLAVCPAIIYTTQASGDFECTFVSENIEQILGYTQREMRDDPDFWTSHIHPQDQRRVVSEVFGSDTKGRRKPGYRFRHRRRALSLVPGSFKTVLDEAGQPVEIVGSWADITQRKLAESFQTLYQASFKIHAPAWGLRSGSTGLSKRRGMSSIWIDSASFSLIPRASGFRQWQALRRQPLEAIRVPIGPAGGGLAQAYQTQRQLSGMAKARAGELRLKPPYDRIEAFRSRVFVIMPLVVQKQTIGVLEAGWKGNRPFDPATVEPFQVLAPQAAVASEHSRLYAAAQPVLRRSLQLKDVYPAFAAAVKALLAYDRIGVVVPEGDQAAYGPVSRRSTAGFLAREVWPEGGRHRGRMGVGRERPRLVRDLRDRRSSPFRTTNLCSRKGVRSTLMLPLIAGEEAVGFFFFDNRTPGAYTERDLEFLEPVAQQLALAIQNNRLLKELQDQSRELARSVEEMKVLREVGQAVNSTLDLQTVLTSHCRPRCSTLGNGWQE